MPTGATGPRPRPPRPQPGNEPTTAIPTQKPRLQNADAPATTAIPTARKSDAEAATEKLNTPDEERKRRGGGVSAQDLLRREGRI
jgi:RND superfamily putative drug exporter